MLRLSKYPFKTLKSTPKVSDNKSTGLLLQGAFIRQEVAGVYSYLHMWQRVLENIKNIIREELNEEWCVEMLMPSIGAKASWEKTDRWDKVDVLFKLQGHGNTEYSLNPTHEEIVTPIAGEFIQSYKDLDFGIYQIQSKFRNESRAKSGLLRWREFVMKDLYSFHKSDESFEEYYENIANAYHRIYERLGIGDITKRAIADGGDFTDKFSHEFQTITEIGEDVIISDSTGYCANLEVACGVADNKNLDEEEVAMERVDADGVLSIDDMVKFFGKPKWQMLKTVLYKKENGEYFAVVIRWDLEVNEIKLSKIVDGNFTQATEEDLEKIGTARGFFSPIKSDSRLEGIKFYGDESLKTVKNFIGWAIDAGVDMKNINLNDLQIDEFHDLNEPAEGFTSVNVEWEVLKFEKASEVWNIFPLVTKFSNPFGLKYTDENGKDNPVLMGCYGIGVSRVMWVIAEIMMDDNGLVWPENIAPYTHYIIVMGDNLDKAEKMAKEIEAKWGSVILDDRTGKTWFGQKASDADLLWIPNRIVISPKTLEQGGYEFKNRKTGETDIISYTF